MNYILFDDKSWDNLLPLTFTRPVCEVRVGIITIKEKWEKYLGVKMSYITQEYLQKKYKLKIEDENILINGSVIPSNTLLKSIQNLGINEVLVKNNKILATRLEKQNIAGFDYREIDKYDKSEYTEGIVEIVWPWDIFSTNGENLIADFELLTKDRKSEKISTSNKVLASENIFIEEGAKVEFATLNATTGPIYIGKNAEVMENSAIRGPFALGENSMLKMGAKIYGPTTIGSYSKVGGEINNSVIFGYSNKAHDGFLGNSVIGEWCNLGADTNNSNLKNNYAEVRLWNYETERFKKTGLQFCGLIMGDHSKCAINTMFNTGTVVGVNSNIYGEGFPRNFIPSFSWGGAHGFSVYSIKKAFEVAELVMARKDKELDETERNILNEIFERTSKYRLF
ncbi:MAG: GlmU family protein [Bacteroidales bacterium]|jgi:UDP-N-acetylglucosamine diphosphorylase/glucosamine-1-phosphate N-acetyltransferase|nr:GlmU family protein [Bacteroidales bacterium]